MANITSRRPDKLGWMDAELAGRAKGDAPMSRTHDMLPTVIMKRSRPFTSVAFACLVWLLVPLLLVASLCPNSRAGYLNPNTGRFWTMDSFEGSSEDPMSLHKYLYAHANPIMGSDPTGQSLLVDLLASTTIRAYLITTVVGYVVGKAINATYLMLSDGNLSRFQWFEYSDTLAMVPGGVLLNAVKLPVQMVTRVGGIVVGKAFASGGVQRVVNGFSQWFASSGGKLVMRSANRAIIELERGTTKKGFQHLLERHLTAFWNGTRDDITTFWPSNVSPGQMLNLLKEAASKYVVGGAPAQSIKLSNGITATLVVHGRKVTTFFPEAGGPGVISASDLVKAVK